MSPTINSSSPCPYIKKKLLICKKQPAGKLLSQLRRIAEQGFCVVMWVPHAITYLNLIPCWLGPFTQNWVYNLCVCVLFVKTLAMQKQEAVGAGKGSGPPPSPPRHSTGQAGRATSQFTGIMQAARLTNRSCEQLEGDRNKPLLYERNKIGRFGMNFSTRVRKD